MSATVALAQDQVTLADLEGMAIEIKVVRQQVLRARGKTYPNRFHIDLRVATGPGADLLTKIDTVSHTPAGAFRAKPQTIATKIEKPGDLPSYGPGNSIWIFQDGKLVNLRTFRNGAYRRDIQFTRSAVGLTCEVTEGFVREEGKPNITWNAPYDNSLVTLISDKLVTATCRIKKP